MKLHFKRDGRVLFGSTYVGWIKRSCDRWVFLWAGEAKARPGIAVIKSEDLYVWYERRKLNELKANLRTAFTDTVMEKMVAACEEVSKQQALAKEARTDEDKAAIKRMNAVLSALTTQPQEN